MKTTKQIEEAELKRIEEEERRKEEQKSKSLFELLIGIFTSFENAEKKKKYLMGMMLVAVNVLVLLIRYAYCVKWLNRTILSENLIYVVPATILPFVLWFMATEIQEFNIYQTKTAMFVLSVANALLVISQYIYSTSWALLLPNVMKLKPNVAMTEDMILGLGRVLVIAPVILFNTIISFWIKETVFSEGGYANLMNLRVDRVFDRRENKENLYDVPLAKDANKIGKRHTLKEQDRFIHMLINGATGVGKTSTIIMNMILSDLTKRIWNEDCRQLAYMEMVRRGEATVQNVEDDGVFWDDYIVPNKGFEFRKKMIQKKYPACGLTVLAPNSGLTDDVARLCEARNIKVNVIDPMPDEKTGLPKKHLIGINPFYIPEGLGEEERKIQISEKAQTFADVLMAINSLKGASDEYFAGINQTVTINVSTICMAAIPLIYKRQANINDVQKCINDYSKLKPLIEALEKKYGYKVKVVSNSKPKGKNNAQTAEQAMNESLEDSRLEDDSVDFENGQDKLYYDNIFFVKQELLGDGAEEMFKQARGLRNIIDNFLANPRVKALLTREDTIDFDEALRKGEVTVCNTAAELGESASTGFGLMFLLLMKQAVYRRRKDERIAHFWYIDEFALYLHSAVEQMFTLFRQYRVGMVVALQTLDQMERTPLTKYLRGVLMSSCATHILFGRMNVSEMKLYSEMIGKAKKMVRQVSKTESSILSVDPKTSMQIRESESEEDVLSGSTMRNRNFKEVTILTTDGGNVQPPIHGMTDFMPYSAYDPVERVEIDWSEVEIAKNPIEKIQKEDLVALPDVSNFINTAAKSPQEEQHIRRRRNVSDGEAMKNSSDLKSDNVIGTGLFPSQKTEIDESVNEPEADDLEDEEIDTFD